MNIKKIKIITYIIIVLLIIILILNILQKVKRDNKKINIVKPTTISTTVKGDPITSSSTPTVTTSTNKTTTTSKKEETSTTTSTTTSSSTTTTTKSTSTTTTKKTTSTTTKHIPVYTCPDGYTLEDTKCTIIINATKVCPTGATEYNQDGIECIKLSDSNAFETSNETCPSGFALIEMINLDGKPSKNICYPGYNKVFYCDHGYKITEDNKCIKTINATLK